MPETVKHVAFMTKTSLWPRWLDRAGTRLIDEAGVERVTHIFPSKNAQPKFGINRIIVGRMFHHLDSGAYNPAGVDALEHVTNKKINRQSYDDGAAVRALVEEVRPDVIISEGCISDDAIKALRQIDGLQIMQFSESWSNGLPAKAAQAMQIGLGYAEIGLFDITVAQAPAMLCVSRSQISPLALNQSIHRHFFKLAVFPLRALTTASRIPSPYPGPISELSTLAVWRLMTTQIWRRLAKKISTKEDRKWGLLLGASDSSPSNVPEFGNMQTINPGPGRLWADPCLVENKGRCYVFFEELVFGEDRGKIVAAEVNETGFLSQPTEVLSESFHLSYPHVFSHDGKWCMIPETGNTGRVELYMAEEFPFRWRHERTLLESVHLYDATFLKHDGLFWIFGTVAEPGASDYDELCIFYARDPILGPWKPHALNPVISDVTRARPAGRFIHHAGEVYRPSQNSRTRYGYGLTMNVVEELTPESYKERTVWQYCPEEEDTPFRGMHTYSSAGGLVVADAIL